MSSHSKQELLQLVERKAFDPVMRAKPEGRSDTEKEKLAHVQQAAEIERYRNYSSAEKRVTNFQRDLHSNAAKRVHAELRSLHLPTIEDIRDEFKRKASQLGVRG